MISKWAWNKSLLHFIVQKASQSDQQSLELQPSQDTTTGSHISRVVRITEVWAKVNARIGGAVRARQAHITGRLEASTSLDGKLNADGVELGASDRTAAVESENLVAQEILARDNVPRNCHGV